MQLKKKSPDDLELMRKAYEKVMGVTPAPIVEGGGPNVIFL